MVVNGEFIKLDLHPLMDRHHLFIPIRALASLGLSYSFNAKTKMTTVQNKNGDYLKITANSHFASNNIQMEVPAQNREGRILVPLRFVSESLGYDIYFEPIRQFVFINAKDYSFDSSILEQEDLQAARKAAIAVPIKADFKTLGTSDDIAYTVIPSLSVEQMYIIYSMVCLHLWKLKRVRPLPLDSFSVSEECHL